MIRLAHVVTHPIQYFAPLYRALTAAGEIDLTVFFGSRHGVEASFDPGFAQTLHFDVPLLSGYRSEFLINRGSGTPDGRFGSFNCCRLLDALKQGRFDALWIHGWGYRMQWQALRAARTLGLPVLMRAETTPLSRSANWLRGIARQLFVGRMLRAVAACFYVGQANNAFYREMGVPQERLLPAHYSVDVEAFARAVGSAQERVALRAELGAGRETFVVATAAKLIARKRIDDLIQAVGQAHSSVHLWVIGDGVGRPALEALANARAPGRVRWFGFVNQSRLPRLLAAADLFALASHEETWGLAINEAMACGLPAVCSDHVGCSADLIRQGNTGYTFGVGDITALVALLEQLRGQPDETRRLGHNAQRLVRQEYDVAVTARQIGTAVQAVTGTKTLVHS